MWPRRTTLPFLGYMVPSFGSEPSVHIVSREKWVWTTWKKLVYHHRPTQLPLPFRLNNDRNRSGPAEALCRFWVIWSHLLAQNPLSIWSTAKLSFEPLWRSWSITTDPPTTPLKLAKFWIFSNVGQTPLGRPLMVLLDWKVVSNASVGCLGVPGVDFGWYEPTSLWPPNHPTPKPNFYLSLR